MASAQITAAAAGTWTPGDLTVNRMGSGAMRRPQTGRALTAGAVPGGRDRAIPGTGDPAHLAENVAAGALRLSPDEMARRGAARW